VHQIGFHYTVTYINYITDKCVRFQTGESAVGSKGIGLRMMTSHLIIVINQLNAQILV